MSEATTRIEKKIDDHLKEHAGPELPVVWVKEKATKDSHGYYITPCCHRQVFFPYTSLRNGELKRDGKATAWCCKKKYIIRIRPDDPVEEYPEGWEGWSVQHWDSRFDGKPTIQRGVVEDLKFLESDNHNIWTQVKNIIDGSVCSKHFTLHATYAEALAVAAGLWEEQKTELYLVTNNYPNHNYEYWLLDAEDIDIKNGIVEPPAMPAIKISEIIYLGPDEGRAEKICAEKNAELKPDKQNTHYVFYGESGHPEVDDSVLDCHIYTKVVNKVALLVAEDPCKQIISALIWYWTYCKYKEEGCPTWRDLFEHSPIWAQWVVDNLAGDVDSRVIEALKARLKASN